MKHWIKISILSILTVLVAVIVYFSFYMLSYSLDADNDRVAKIHKVYERVIKENPELKNFRLVLSASVAKIVKSGMDLLGIEVPERM